MFDTSLLQYFSDEITKSFQLSCHLLRLDLLHPVVSGNKIFKLKFYIEKAKNENKTTLLTLGGSHSNHLVATAYAAKSYGFKSIGIVRGEETKKPSTTLLECIEYGMELIYVSRSAFGNINLNDYSQLNPEALIIPHGGYGLLGAKGAATILDLVHKNDFDIIIAACGTGTMGAGLVSSALPRQKIILTSVLKNNISVRREIDTLLTEMDISKAYEIRFENHLGGYAKKNSELFDFMNRFHDNHNIPTDFVYTGKMLYSFYQMMIAAEFPENSRILLIHSGGLQGNRSLTNHELKF